MDAAYNGKFHIKFFDFFDIIYRVEPNKATSLVWGQWDLNPAGKWFSYISGSAAYCVDRYKHVTDR